jgi:RimJ/RimL family protein N-acetyltransferase
MKILETERLYLRKMTIKDAENVYLLNLDWDVLKYTGDQPFESIESAKQFLENYNHYRKYNFGRWAVIHKTTNEFLGWCGLKYTPELDEYDIGFRFLKKYWNRGFATESAKACLNLGFNKYQITEIVGRAMVDNIGSIKVLKKIGLTFYKKFNFDGENGLIYKVTDKSTTCNNHEN